MEMSSSLRTKGMECSIWVEFRKLAYEVNPVNIGQGNPNFMAPDTIRKALADVALDEDNFLYHQYTRDFGHMKLVETLAKLYSKELKRTIDPYNEILITGGAYLALYMTISGIVNPGDEVIIIEPFFDCYVPQIELAEGKTVFIPLRPTKTEGIISSADWKLDETELRESFCDKTKAIIINTPNNPSGKMFTRDELTMIADLCKKHNVIAIMDEVYEWIQFDGNEHVRMASLPEMWERTVTIGSVGKTFSVTGWKTGWAIGPKELLKGAQVIHQHSNSSCITPIQEAVARAFEIELERIDTPQCYFKSLAAELKGKRDKIISILREYGLNPIVPEGGYFVLVDVSSIMNKVDFGADSDSSKDFLFAKWLSKTYKLQGIPPCAFYSKPHIYMAEKYIRFCFIKKDETLEKVREILSQLSLNIK